MGYVLSVCLFQKPPRTFLGLTDQCGADATMGVAVWMWVGADYTYLEVDLGDRESEGLGKRAVVVFGELCGSIPVVERSRHKNLFGTAWPAWDLVRWLLRQDGGIHTN